MKICDAPCKFNKACKNNQVISTASSIFSKWCISSSVTYLNPKSSMTNVNDNSLILCHHSPSVYLT